MYNIDKTECDNLLIWVVFEISLAIDILLVSINFWFLSADL